MEAGSEAVDTAPAELRAWAPTSVTNYRTGRPTVGTILRPLTGPADALDVVTHADNFILLGLRTAPSQDDVIGGSGPKIC